MVKPVANPVAKPIANDAEDDKNSIIQQVRTSVWPHNYKREYI